MNYSLFPRLDLYVRRAMAALAAAQEEFARAERGVLEGLFGAEWVEWAGWLSADELEVLSGIRIRGGCWEWTGAQNSKGTMVYRQSSRTGGARNTQLSVAKALHVMLVPGHAPQKALHPYCGNRRCVLPLHRCRECGAGAHLRAAAA